MSVLLYSLIFFLYQGSLSFAEESLKKRKQHQNYLNIFTSEKLLQMTLNLFGLSGLRAHQLIVWHRESLAHPRLRYSDIFPFDGVGFLTSLCQSHSRSHLIQSVVSLYRSQCPLNSLHCFLSMHNNFTTICR